MNKTIYFIIIIGYLLSVKFLGLRQTYVFKCQNGKKSFFFHGFVGRIAFEPSAPQGLQVRQFHHCRELIIFNFLKNRITGM